MYSHGPHMDVTDLELSPIVGIGPDIGNNNGKRLLRYANKETQPPIKWV
jgi:hypothetical protein